MSSENASLARPEAAFPSVRQVQRRDDYFVYFCTDVGPTVAALIAYLNAQGDPLVDLRVERPTLEDRFLEITTQESGR